MDLYNKEPICKNIVKTGSCSQPYLCKICAQRALDKRTEKHRKTIEHLIKLYGTENFYAFTYRPDNNETIADVQRFLPKNQRNKAMRSGYILNTQLDPDWQGIHYHGLVFSLDPITPSYSGKLHCIQIRSQYEKVTNAFQYAKHLTKPPAQLADILKWLSYMLRYPTIDKKKDNKGNSEPLTTLTPEYVRAIQSLELRKMYKSYGIFANKSKAKNSDLS